jgi:hypothetical protein
MMMKLLGILGATRRDELLEALVGNVLLLSKFNVFAVDCQDNIRGKRTFFFSAGVILLDS